MSSLSSSQVQVFWQRLNRNRLTTVGLFMFVLVAVLCIITPFLPLKDPDATDLVNRLLPPLSNDEFLLGTDQLGRDVLSRLLWGTRVSLLVGFVATLVAEWFLNPPTPSRTHTGTHAHTHTHTHKVSTLN